MLRLIISAVAFTENIQHWDTTQFYPSYSIIRINVQLFGICMA